MDSEGFFIWLGAMAVGVVIGLGLLFVRLARDAKNMPDEFEQQQLIKHIQHMQRQGHTYAERLAYLQAQGLRRNTADYLLGEAQRLETAKQ